MEAHAAVVHQDPQYGGALGQSDSRQQSDLAGEVGQDLDGGEMLVQVNVQFFNHFPDRAKDPQKKHDHGRPHAQAELLLKEG